MLSKKRIGPKEKTHYWQAFGFAFGAATLLFLPWMITTGGYFLYYGDYNVQQIPFYRLAHEAIRTGNTGWSWVTDLGANFVGSYSFYNIGSPFFWLTLPFPTDFVPYLMGPLFILKFSCASLFAYAYLRRFISSQSAVIAALLYAFSGFAIYNIFFNHFHEAIVLFPLLLLSLELFMVENRRGIFAFVIALCAISNYFFFITMVVFVVIYWFVRVLSGAYTITVKRFGILFFEAVLGVGLACVLLVPSYLSVIQNPRVSNYLSGWDMLTYWSNDGRIQIYPHIFQTFFFLPEWPARPIWFTGAEQRWSSISGWLPLFGMIGVLALFKTVKKYWLKTLLIILAIFAYVPILNSLFYLGNATYYARWFYMPILMLALATGIAIDKHSTNWKFGIKSVSIITGLFIVAIGMIPNGYTNVDTYNQLVASGEQQSSIWGWWSAFINDHGVYDHGGKGWPATAFFWITCAIAVICIIVVAKLVPLIKRNKQRFYAQATAAILITVVLYGNYYIGVSSTLDASQRELIPELLHFYDDFDLEGYDETNFRIDFAEGSMDNSAMYFDKPSIQAFQSVVPGTVMEFNNYIGVERDVASRPDYEHSGLRVLTSVRYFFEYTGAMSDEEIGNFSPNRINNTKMPGYTYAGEQFDYEIWENDNFVPYGFVFDDYVLKSELDTMDPGKREYMMLKGIVLDDAQIKNKNDTEIVNQVEKYGQYYNKLDLDPYYNQTVAELSQGIDEDADKLDETNAEYFAYDNEGFTAEITMEKPSLVFFSVPYDQGWSATVDGQPAEIEKVDVGFMAVFADVGTHTIRFEYEVPGLKNGFIISVTSILILIGYIGANYVYYKKHEKPIYPTNDHDIFTDKYDYIKSVDSENEAQWDREGKGRRLGDGSPPRKDYFNDNFDLILEIIQKNIDDK